MKKLIITLSRIVTLATGNFGVCWSGDFQKGSDAYDKGVYATVFREWKLLADQGDAVAQYNLGVIFIQKNI